VKSESVEIVAEGIGVITDTFVSVKFENLLLRSSLRRRVIGRQCIEPVRGNTSIMTRDTIDAFQQFHVPMELSVRTLLQAS